jgi:hypothetical protein
MSIASAKGRGGTGEGLRKEPRVQGKTDWADLFEPVLDVGTALHGLGAVLERHRVAEEIRLEHLVKNLPQKTTKSWHP